MEPNKGNIVRYTLALHIEGTQHANCQSVIGGKDGVYWWVELQ